MTVLGQRLETNFRHGVAEGLRHPVAGLWKVSTSRSPVPLQITDLPSTPWPDPDNRLVWFKMRPKVGESVLVGFAALLPSEAWAPADTVC
jgi:hypothetical protein